MKTTNKYEQNIAAEKILAITGLFVVLGLMGCQQEGAAEKAGQKLDRSIESTGKKIEQMAEQAGKEISDAKKETGKSIAETTEASGQYIDDSVITASVKAAILNDPFLKVSQIKVTTVNGVVQLSGALDSQESIDRAGEVAKNQKNVKSVQNDLILIASTPSEE
jgi:hyperosmotically inducible protein